MSKISRAKVARMSADPGSYLRNAGLATKKQRSYARSLMRQLGYEEEKINLSLPTLARKETISLLIDKLLEQLDEMKNA